jgi:hypothetical protein
VVVIPCQELNPSDPGISTVTKLTQLPGQKQCKCMPASSRMKIQATLWHTKDLRHFSPKSNDTNILLDCVISTDLQGWS